MLDRDQESHLDHVRAMQQAALNVLCKIGLIIVVVILELVETRFHRFVGVRIPHTGFKLVQKS